MNAPAAISGDFATYKHVQGRKMLQLVIEVPAEMASAVFAALGTPGSGEAIPVALARLVDDARVEPEHVKERRSFADMPLPQQAALRCHEPQFREFLVNTDRMRLLNATPDDFAEVVRQLCGVKSRADIGKGPNDRSVNDSGFKWRALDAEYYAWQRGRR